MIRKQTSLFLLTVVLILLTQACSFTTAKIDNVVLTADPEAGAPRDVFSPNETFYLVVVLDNAPDDTVLKTTWVAAEVEEVEPDLIIDEVEITTGLPIVTFDMSNEYLWPTGSYRVDLYLNGELYQSLDFRVLE
jgi:hypothetical protein